MTCAGCDDLRCVDCNKSLSVEDIFYFQQNGLDMFKNICLECFSRGDFYV